MKVKYKFATGENSEIEVTPEVAELLEKLDREDANARRKDRWRNEASVEVFAESSDWEPSDEQNIEMEYILREESEGLASAIARLNERQQMLVRLCFYDGLLYEEIARNLNVSRATITKQFDALCKKLKKFLKMG